MSSLESMKPPNTNKECPIGKHHYSGPYPDDGPEWMHAYKEAERINSKLCECWHKMHTCNHPQTIVDLTLEMIILNGQLNRLEFFTLVQPGRVRGTSIPCGGPSANWWMQYFNHPVINCVLCEGPEKYGRSVERIFRTYHLCQRCFLLRKEFNQRITDETIKRKHLLKALQTIDSSINWPVSKAKRLLLPYSMLCLAINGLMKGTIRVIFLFIGLICDYWWVIAILVGLAYFW